MIVHIHLNVDRVSYIKLYLDEDRIYVIQKIENKNYPKD